MSTLALNKRQRAQSTVSLRKRIIRGSSEERTSEMKKSSTMTSFRPKLERMIQEGKIEQIMNSDSSSKAQLFYSNHVSEMEKELSSSKKSFSTLVTKVRAKESAINLLKNDIKKVDREAEIIRNEAASAQQVHADSKQQLISKRNQKEEIFWEDKVLDHLKQRGYKDEVQLRGRYEALQREHDVESQNRVLLEKKYHELKKINQELAKVRNEAFKISRFQAQEKSQFISILEADMSERELLGELKAEKHKRQGQINEIAPSLIEKEQLQRILQILSAHRILSQIIRTKSNSLLQRYQDVNKAYNHIKSNSNIIEPDKILKRMEEHDTLYDAALKRVTALQGQLGQLQTNFEQNMQKRNGILSQEGKEETLQKGYYQGLERDKYELLLSEREKLRERETADEVLRKNIEAWSGRMFQRYGIHHSQRGVFQDCLTDLVVRIGQKQQS